MYVCSKTLDTINLLFFLECLGLDYCHLRLEGNPRSPKGVASVVYTNPQWASYAREKFHGFEYPPGYRLIVKPEMDNNM